VWGQALQNGATLQSVALAIALSPEALARIVTTDYQELLGRVPEAAGQAFWVNQLEQGGSSALLLVNIACSAEFIALQGGLDPAHPSPIDALATTPLPISGTNDIYWTLRELQNETRTLAGHAPFLFLGDSITER